MTLYLKYRPQKIADLDLASAREALSHLLKKGDIPHAFLFAGPRGTGKTSSARILAKAINCEKNVSTLAEPCNKCDTCLSITKGTNLDVIEMDAASNRGIDEVRALKQDIMLAPTMSRKKVYIIDEVHMLTTEAANALLKTLEEPPAHVVFILATTDPQKLPATVVSRLSVIPFHKASEEEVTSKLKKISESEGFNVEDGVYPKIASLADGSFRDAVKTLEELSLAGKDINISRLEELFQVGGKQARELLDRLISEGAESSVRLISEFANNGVEGKGLLTSLIHEVHTELLMTIHPANEVPQQLTQKECVALLELLLEAKSRLNYATTEFLPIEIALLKFNQLNQAKTDNPPLKKVETLPRENKIEEKPNEVLGEQKKTETIPDTKTDRTIDAVGSTFDDTLWNKILSELKLQNAGVEALLRAAKPLVFDGRALTVGVYFQFHKERLEVAQNRIAFESVLHQVLGDAVKVDYCLSERQMPVQTISEPSLTMPDKPDIINAAKEIFGN